MQAPLRILLLDDEAEVEQDLTASASANGLRVDIDRTSDVEEFRRKCIKRAGFYDFAFLDIQLKTIGSSLEYFGDDPRIWYSLPVIVLTKHVDEKIQKSAFQLGAANFCRKIQIGDFWETNLFTLKSQAEYRKDLSEAATEQNRIVGTFVHQLRGLKTDFRMLLDMAGQVMENEDSKRTISKIKDFEERIHFLMRTFAQYESWVRDANCAAVANDVSISDVVLNAVAECTASPSISDIVEFRTTITDMTCSCDKAKLHVIISNLLRNAARYAPRRNPLVEISNELIQIDHPEMDLLEIRVRDYGIGVNDKADGNIYEPFKVGESSSQMSSLGLGLAIVKDMCHAHEIAGIRGTVYHEACRPGVVFTASLPIRRHD